MKTYQTLTISVITSITLAIGFSACGGGSDSATTETGTAYYVDSAVAGVEFQCGGQNGTTGEDGRFTFEYGKDCSFTLGSIPLKTIPATYLGDGAKIVETNATVAAVLQSLDADGNVSNGITITPSIITVIKESNITSLPTDDTGINDLVTTIGNAVDDVNLTVVSIADAEEHLVTTQTTVTVEQIANKTFYLVDEYYKELTKLDFQAVEGSTTELDVNSTILAGEDEGMQYYNLRVDINGTNIIKTFDGTYFVVEAQTDDYLLLKDYNSTNSSLRATDRLYFNLEKAEAYYNSLYFTQATLFNSVWAIDDGTNFQYLTLLSDGTFIYAEYDNDSEEPENGVEVGAYTINENGSITFTVNYDGNYVEDAEDNATDVSGVGSIGSPTTYPFSISDDGTKLTVTINDDEEGESTIVFDNITAHVDMWKSTDTDMSTPLFSFLELDTANNKFLYAEYDNEFSEPENGLEAGTYSLASDEITFDVQYDGNYVVDDNGDYNATDISGVGSLNNPISYPISLSEDGNTLTVTIDNEDNDTITFTKLF